MINSLIRSLIVYIAVIPAVRLMGKRQIGELQPSELVITLLLSEVAAMTLQNNSIPLITSLILIFALAGFEVVSSDLCMNYPIIRKLIQGNPVLVIKNGKINEKKLRALRYSVDDLLEALRLKDVFDIKSVDFAYVETNGSVSVKLKKNYRPPTKVDDKAQDGVIPYIVIGDGKIIDREFRYCNMTRKKLDKILIENKADVRDVLLMTVDSTGEYSIIRRQAENI